MGANDAGPGLSARGVTFAGHTFAAWTRADPGVIWTALTDPGQTAAFLYGLAADSTWIPGSPLRFSCGGGVRVSGRVLRRTSGCPSSPPCRPSWIRAR
jgi:hypothetical protein